MTTNPLFQAPTDIDSGENSRGELIQIDTALESMRDSGFDLTAAAGEPIDNSIEAAATVIRVIPQFGPKKQSIDQIGFADNGRGIDKAILPRVLSMGFSSRYGQRGGLGRFGVGLKLAGLSLGRRIDVYTKQDDDAQIRHVYLDLDEIKTGAQTFISTIDVENWPEAYEAAMQDGEGNPLPSGTLVLYSKVDRLTSGGTYGTSLDEKIKDLRSFIARAYRKFLDQGLIIELSGQPVTLLDPLFLLDNPRIMQVYKPRDLRGRVIDEEDIEIEDGHHIHVTVTVVPEDFRPKSGAGGLKDSSGRDIRQFQIDDSAGKVSMIRNGREINYDIVPRLLPNGIDKVDRYVGIEVTFPAELDEFFQVRNVKRGAVPVLKLREKLRSWLEPTVKLARKEIRAYWGEVETKERAGGGQHDSVIDAVARAEQTAPMGQAGRDISEIETKRIIDELLADMQLDEETDADEIQRVRKQIEVKPITLVDSSWPGKELFEIEHLNGKAIVKINYRHPLIREAYEPLHKAAQNGGEGMDTEDLLGLIRKGALALDVLFLGYAKAENLHRDPEQFSDLRSYWGQHTHAYIREALKDDDV